MSVELLTEGQRCEWAEAIGKVCISSELPWEEQTSLSVAGNPVLWAADWPVRCGCHKGKKADNSEPRCFHLRDEEGLVLNQQLIHLWWMEPRQVREVPGRSQQYLHL